MRYSVFRKLNNYAKKWKILDLFFIFCARFLPYLIIGFLFVFLIFQKNEILFIYAIIAGGIARLLNEVVHIFYKKERPAYLENTKVLIPLPKNYSFPSGHASFLFGASLYVLFYFPVIGLSLILFSFIVGIARVFCGVHWFRDILGGFVCGIISVFITNYLINLWI